MNERVKVLLPEASGRQALPMVRALKKLGCEVFTVQEKKSDLGAVTRYADRKLIAPGVDSDSNVAASFYSNLARTEDFDLVIPLSDFSAGIFAGLKRELESASKVKIAVNDSETFAQAFDKLNTMKVCMENGLPCPRTLDAVASLDDVPTDVAYPVVLKPRSSCGSIGFHIARDRTELGGYIERSANENLGPILVQEFIPQDGKQYNAHFVFDKNSDVKSAVIAEKCRWFPLDGGASSLCRTIRNDRIFEICVRLLKTIGWVGYCDVDLMEDPRDGSIRIIEINARISANVKLCFAAGVNVAEQLLQLYLGDEVDERLDYKEDVRLRCVHTDLLWFLKSPNRFKTEPSWFSLKNTVDQIASWDDPLPFFTFSFQALLKYRREMKKRER